MKKQIATLALAGVLSLGIAGCGCSQQPKTTDDTANKTEQTSEKTEQKDEQKSESTAQKSDEATTSASSGTEQGTEPAQTETEIGTSEAPGSGIEAYIPQDLAIENATTSTGASDTAENVSASLQTKGDLAYYLVTFDVANSDGVSYEVRINAYDGSVLGVLEFVNGTLQTHAG